MAARAAAGTPRKMAFSGWYTWRVSSPAFEALRTSFEGYETSFADRDELERYRATVLEKTEHQARFVAARVEGGAAVEAACGNGRLLVSLARMGAIDAGLGIDLAQSRI